MLQLFLVVENKAWYIGLRLGLCRCARGSIHTTFWVSWAKASYVMAGR